MTVAEIGVIAGLFGLETLVFGLWKSGALGALAARRRGIGNRAPSREALTRFFVVLVLSAIVAGAGLWVTRRAEGVRLAVAVLGFAVSWSAVVWLLRPPPPPPRHQPGRV